MKKYPFILVFFMVFGSSFGQTILNRFPIELKKSSSYFQIFNAENEQKDYFAFISDKQKLTAVKYNSALFFSDTLSISRPSNDYDFMAGVTFSADETPNLYWSSKDYKKVQLIHFDFKNHTTSNLIYTNNFERDKIVDAFVAHNSLHIVSITSDDKLKFTHFSNNGKNEYVVSLDLENQSTNQSGLIKTLFENGITPIEVNLFNPLYVGVAKVKRYLSKDQYILTFDRYGLTTAFTVNLKDFTLNKKFFSYEVFADKAASNSYLHQNVLYQVTANANALSLIALDFDTQTRKGSYQVDAKTEISFKNSPLILQSESGRTRELKNTSKFLSKIDYEDVGLSIYATPNYHLFTIGGVRQVASAGSMFLGAGLTIGGALSGAFIDATPMVMEGNAQSLYFESFFDKDFQHVKTPFQPLYIDALGGFLDTNRLSVYNIYAFENYVILNYYDSKNNEFVMRKFEDVSGY